jgi:hypothetical protein
MFFPDSSSSVSLHTALILIPQSKDTLGYLPIPKYALSPQGCFYCLNALSSFSNSQDLACPSKPW